MKKFKIKAKGGLLITYLLINTLWCIGNQTTSMAKQPKSGNQQPPKKRTGDDLWAVPFNQTPAYAKLKAEKAKQDSTVAAYAKKAAAEKAAGIAKLKKK